MQKRKFLRGAASLLVVAASGPWAAGAAAAAYPDQPIRLVVGFPPGGGGDLYGRTIANALGRRLGQTVIVDNKPGAGGEIAADFVSRAKPDGYTLILAMSGNFASGPAIRPNLGYKAPDDFVPIARLVETPFGLMVASSSPIRTVADFVAEARRGKLSYASTGTGGAAQIVMEMVKQQASLDVLHVPYKGSGPALTDLYGGQVGSFFAPYTPLIGQIRGGRLRLLAVSSEKRIAALPEVPTLKESGIDVVMTQWYGLAAPAGTPPAVVETLGRTVADALKDPDVLRIFQADGATASGVAGAAFRDDIVRDIARYRQAVERGNLKAE